MEDENPSEIVSGTSGEQARAVRGETDPDATSGQLR